MKIKEMKELLLEERKYRDDSLSQATETILGGVERIVEKN